MYRAKKDGNCDATKTGTNSQTDPTFRTSIAGLEASLGTLNVEDQRMNRWVEYEDVVSRNDLYRGFGCHSVQIIKAEWNINQLRFLKAAMKRLQT